MRKLVVQIVLTLFTSSLITFPVSAQTNPEQALETCMQKTAAQRAMIGGIVGAFIGAFLGGDNRQRRQNAAAGAGLGALAGGAYGWQTSWKSCTESLNLVTLSSVRSEEFVQVAERYQYDGKASILKIEEAFVNESVVGGNQLSTGFKIVLLKPDPVDTNVEIGRSWRCGDTDISLPPEKYSITPGTTTTVGNVLVPKLDPKIKKQSCVMKLTVEADGLKDEWSGSFEIIPG